MLNKYFLIFLGFLPIIGLSQTISVDDTQTLDQLIDGVLISGDCADVTNITSPNNSSLAGEGYESYASFDASSANFPFTDGIVLANKEVTGIPNDTGDSGSNAWTGDADLEALIQEPGNTNNATVIEFSFTPYVDEISFNYLLASNEWPSFVCSYADTFAFILSGPGISDINSYDHDANPNTPDLQLDLGGLNIATIPGTNIPVSPVNIHLDDDCAPGSLGEYAVPQLFDQTFSDNGSTEFTGQTEPLFVSTSVIPGETYQIKLVIADRQDTILDSAVFIEGSSFDIGEVDLGPDITLGSDEAVCEGDVITLDAGPGGDNTSYTWFKDFEEIPGETGQFLDVTESGTYSVAVAFSLDCLQTDSITVEFFPEPQLPDDQTIVLCAGETATLDGTPNNLSDIVNPQYQWTQDGEPISGDGPTLTVDEAGVYEIDVDAQACTNVNTTFTVNLVDYTIDLGEDVSPCTAVDATNSFEIVPFIDGVPDADLDQVDYSWSTGDTSETITVDQDGTYTLTTTYQGCAETDDIQVTFRQASSVNLGNDFKSCFTDAEVIDTGLPNDDANITFRWFRGGSELTNENASSLEVEEEGTYEVEVNNEGCISTDEIVVTGYDVDNCTITQGLSPNDDGDNDCLDLTFLADRTGIDNIQLFNRYGRKVFESNNYVNEFCGQDDDGDMLTTGTYFYVIKLSSEDNEFGNLVKGYIYISEEQ
ncbi:MAG: choice-of-anchor L domain-containing protein [Psychroflexus sp.]|nr:choice-of-anchor L domain-containing protein [Psychroflexus sp.]